MEAKGQSHNTLPKNGVSDEKTNFLPWFSQLNEKSPNDSLFFIVNNRTAFLSLLRGNGTNDDIMSLAIITLGKACNADNHHRKMLDKLIINLSLTMNHIIYNFVNYLLLLKKIQVLENHHFDALLHLAKFLKTFQMILPSYSSHLMPMLLLSLESTCDGILKNQTDFFTYHISIRQILKHLEDKQKHFSDTPPLLDKEKLPESEKLQLEEPPENFRSLSIIPTVDDIHMTRSFLRPNLVKGKYKDVEHYLDVQFRLLREDYIKPLRDGVAEYRKFKKGKKSFKSCQNVRFYYNAFVHSEKFVEGDLLHEIQFSDKCFSTIKWENSKRFLTGNILCLSMDDFRTMSFATVIKSEPRKLRKGLLLVKFVEIEGEMMNFVSPMNYVVIELSTLFESYRHNLKALQKLDDSSLPMKNYIVNVEKSVNKPGYLQSTTVFDMRPLLFPLEMGLLISHQIYQREKHFTRYNKNFLKKNEWPETSELKLDESQYIALKSEKYKAVQVTNEKKWPSASELKMDESQYIALKSAIMKEFSIIQGPPGTGKTYIGLRIVQLLLHNLDAWFDNESGSMPILIVCYTNHALDQFLEGISHLTKKIVRFGGRGSNKRINKFRIKNLVTRARENKSIPRYIGRAIYEARTEIEKIEKEIKYYESYLYDLSANKVVQEDILEEYIPSGQFAFLKSNYSDVDKCQNAKGKIYEWLEVDTFSELQLNSKGCEEKPLIYNNVDKRGRESEIENSSDFNDITASRNISESNKNCDASDEHRYQNRETKQNEYIRNSLRSNPIMKNQRALRIRNVWRLSIKERWQLYKFWLNRFLEREKQQYSNLQHRLKNAFEELWSACVERDLFVLEDAVVVGMTTTGASKFRHIIEARNPVVLIVEEAAETLESHIITSLAPKTKHVILIGDQQQLRPSPTVYTLAENYGMNISLFERMIINEVEYCRLLLQHRMRPEIASLIVPHIYPDLKNDEIVTKFENIKGMEKDVFFITHTFDEQHMQDSKSKTNVHEAKFIIRLCKYLLYQGYEPSQITVLTTYSAQLFLLNKLAVDRDVRKVRFTVVDNFQGEENDIILISFVRSNSEGNIGFLKISNRVCVALSRAKKGLYCIGNFALLAEKSELWKNILQTLTTSKFIGSSLRLVCQNHPHIFTDVASDSDFDSVPEGGCNRKCEYNLSCGHLCTIMCHPYDPDHEKFKCKKPCTKICENGHSCKKMCFNDCKPCPVNVEKVLSICGHTVNAACGKNEFEIECPKPCKQSCKEGHPCPKKCFESCGSCNFMVNKVLSICGHTVNAACGKNEYEIECPEPCKKSCEEGHPCPKKCFESCGSCNFMVSKVLSRCGHTVNAACGENETDVECHEACKKSCEEGHPCQKKCFEDCGSCEVMVDKILTKCNHTVKAPCSKPKEKIRCENQCYKTCSKNHPCQKKCFEACGSCEVIIEKTLNYCGHSVMAPCGMEENEIKCLSPCNKTLPCSHRCKNKCYEQCCKKCLKLVEIRSPVCGHTFKIECCFAQDSVELAKRCLEPCKNFLPCGHLCKGTCRACEQGNKHRICNETCQKLLFCGHLCSNICTEPCVVKCEKPMQISSPVCGHFINIECYLSNNLNELAKRCLTPCKEILPCGHTCGGNCSYCYQGRLHVSCREPCNKILICGHKCESECFMSCPPCTKPCENRCTHKKCPKKCGDPCVKCVKPCKWSCNHKKCTRLCSEICNRSPCNKKCSKNLPCGHPCVAFCGEPCPKECFMCDGALKKIFSALTNEKCFSYIYLEDCQHILKEDDLRKSLVSHSSGLQKIELKTCPQCGTIIRTNFRFNKIIKSCISDLEKIKQVTKYSKDKNLNLQKNLLKLINESYSSMNYIYKPAKKVLSAGRIRDIYELTNLERIMKIAKEIELNHCDSYPKSALPPFIEKIIICMRFCRECMTDFIGKNFLSASEYQLQQLSKEAYRMSLLSFLLNFAKQKQFTSLSPEFEKCASAIMHFNSLSDENIENFNRHIKKFVSNLQNLPTKISYPQEIVNMSALWYRCSKGHIICLSNNLETSQRRDCYKCRKVVDNEQYLKLPKTHAEVENESKSDESDKALNENTKPISDGNTMKQSRKFSKKNERCPTSMKMEPVGKKTISSNHNKKFRRKFCPDVEFSEKSCISTVPECGYSESKLSKTHAEAENESKSNESDKALNENTKPTFIGNTEKQIKKFSKKDERCLKSTKTEPVNKKIISSNHNRKFRREFCPDVGFSEKSCISTVPEYSKINASRKSFEANGDDRQSIFPIRSFKRPISKNAPGRNSERNSHETFLKQTKTFKDATSKDNFSGKNAEKSCGEKSLNPAKFFNKPTSRDIVSQKQTEVTDEKISRVIKAFSELSVEER